MKTGSVTVIDWTLVVNMDHEWVENRVRFGSALLALSFFFRLDLRVRLFIIWVPTSSASSDSLM